MERKPDWLKIKLEHTPQYPRVRRLVEQHNLHTICSSGRCPNIGQCWSMGTATFMILGNICTRSCKFCATATGKPLPVDATEAQHVAESVKLMQLKHCVITSVDRDDLPDKGAAHWAATIIAVRNANPQTTIEVLIPDFDATPGLIDVVVAAKPDIIGHNVETVERLTPLIRSRASYHKSLRVLQHVAQRGVVAKSGLMVGLGETPGEVAQTMHEVRKAGVRLFTVGQYLQPTSRHIPVATYIKPEQFEQYKKTGFDAGFDHIESGPLVRSSYMAEKSFLHSKIKL
jgi:lipoic acid synthetase